MASYPCPNPVCTHSFAAGEVQAAGALTCPQCGNVFRFRTVKSPKRPSGSVHTPAGSLPGPATAKPTPLPAPVPLAQPVGSPAPPPMDDPFDLSAGTEPLARRRPAAAVRDRKRALYVVAS